MLVYLYFTFIYFQVCEVMFSLHELLPGGLTSEDTKLVGCCLVAHFAAPREHSGPVKAHILVDKLCIVPDIETTHESLTVGLPYLRVTSGCVCDGFDSKSNSAK